MRLNDLELVTCLMQLKNALVGIDELSARGEVRELEKRLGQASDAAWRAQKRLMEIEDEQRYWMASER